MKTITLAACLLALCGAASAQSHEPPLYDCYAPSQNQRVVLGVLGLLSLGNRGSVGGIARGSWQRQCNERYNIQMQEWVEEEKRIRALKSNR